MEPCAFKPQLTLSTHSAQYFYVISCWTYCLFIFLFHLYSRVSEDCCSYCYRICHNGLHRVLRQVDTHSNQQHNSVRILFTLCTVQWMVLLIGQWFTILSNRPTTNFLHVIDPVPVRMDTSVMDIHCVVLLCLYLTFKDPKGTALIVRTV